MQKHPRFALVSPGGQLLPPNSIQPQLNVTNYLPTLPATLQEPSWWLPTRGGDAAHGGATDLGEAPDRAEEVCVVAPGGGSVCQGLGELWRLHHVPFGDLLWLVNSF